MSEKFVTTFRVNEEIGRLKNARGMAPRVFRMAYKEVENMGINEVAQNMLSLQGPFDDRLAIQVDRDYHDLFAVKADEVGLATVSDLVRIGMTLVMRKLELA